jgi:nucleotide-binding universal stress UspA family protein
MRVVCCVDGEGSAGLLAATIARLAPIETLTLLYCIDAGHHDEVRLAQGSILGRMHRGERHDAQLSAAEEQRAAAALAEAATAARDAGYQGQQETRILPGRPGHEIVQALADLRADVVGLYPRPPARQMPPGPHSLGHAARFIVDHAPCAVLLVRTTR